MRVVETKLEGCFIVEPSVFDDHRGVFFEGFNVREFKKLTGVDFLVKQMNCSKSKRGVVRGLHFQKDIHAQSKLVFVTRGEVLDVIVDIRQDSPTFGQHVKEKLSESNRKRIYVPKGFAHGFIALSEEAELNYLVDEYYHAAYDAGIIYSDPDLKIDWGLKKDDVILSEKDKNLPTLKKLISE